MPSLPGTTRTPRIARPRCTRPARRAQLTLGGLKDGWPALQDINHATDEALYTFSFEDLVAWITERDDATDRLFLIAHNPALTDLINWLCGDVVLPNLPTAGFVRLTLHIDRWADLAEGCGTLNVSLFPRELAEN